MLKNLKELTNAELLMEKSHAEQVGEPWSVYLLDIDEELEARRSHTDVIEAFNMPTFSEYLENKLNVKIEPYSTFKKVTGDHGCIQKQWTKHKYLKQYTQRCNGALVTVVFDPFEHELKKMSCDKRKDNKYYKQHAENDFTYLADMYYNFDGQR